MTGQYGESQVIINCSFTALGLAVLLVFFSFSGRLLVFYWRFIYYITDIFSQSFYNDHVTISILMAILVSGVLRHCIMSSK